MNLSRRTLFRNWPMKVFSLVLAAMLWAVVASDPTSEIGLSVPIEYQNIPAKHEVVGDASDRAEVRVRGPSSLLRALSPDDVSISIDMAEVPKGQERIMPFTEEHIRAPFGIEVIRVIPARARFVLEPTVSKTVRLQAPLNGEPRSGFEVEKVTITPDTVDVEGPASHIKSLQVLTTTAVELNGKRETFTQPVDLDITDPYIRVPKTPSVQVEVKIRRN